MATNSFLNKYVPPTFKIQNTNLRINLPGLSLNFGSYPNAGLNGLSFGGLGSPLNLIGVNRTYNTVLGGLRTYPNARLGSFNPYAYSRFPYSGFSNGLAPIGIKAAKVENKNVTINIMNN